MTGPIHNAVPKARGALSNEVSRFARFQRERADDGWAAETDDLPALKTTLSWEQPKSAINYVRSFKAEGETWTDHAMHHVFETPGLRAVFLLSDGAPKRDGQRLPTDPILKWIKEANRFSRVRIHTVGFEQAGSKMRKFMGAIARQNHGKYVELK